LTLVRKAGENSTMPPLYVRERCVSSACMGVGD
jgi:hypothetical protein